MEKRYRQKEEHKHSHHGNDSHFQKHKSRCLEHDTIQSHLTERVSGKTLMHVTPHHGEPLRHSFSTETQPVFSCFQSLSPPSLSAPFPLSLSNSFSKRGISESSVQDRVSNLHGKGTSCVAWRKSWKTDTLRAGEPSPAGTP